MGLFNFNDKSNSTNTQAPTKIDPSVLASLNLTQEDVDQNNKEAVQKEAIDEGASYYKEVSTLGDISGANPVKLGPIALNPNTKDKSDLIDSLKDQIAKMAPAMQLQDVAHIELYLEGFAKGYIDSALATKDWQTVVKSADATTQGGISKNTEILKNLAEAFAQDKETRIQIAQLVQSRIGNIQIEPTATTPPNSPQSSPEPPKSEPIPPQIPVNLDSIPHSIEPHPVETNPIQSQPAAPIAQIKSQEPVIGPGGIVLRPVPKPFPGDLNA